MHFISKLVQRLAPQNCFVSKNILQRQAHKSKYNGEVSKPVSEAYLQVISSGAGQPPSLAFVTTHESYLFNIGDSLNRELMATGLRLTKFRNIFITQSKWQCMGGVPALLLLSYNAYGAFPRFHGPRNLYKIIQRIFHLSTLHRVADLPISKTYNAQNYFEDGAVRVDFIELSAKKESEVAFAYFCKLKRRSGGFSIAKTVEHNVPAGPLIMHLLKGEDVTLEDGTVVKASDVRNPDLPEVYFLVVDVPSEKFLPKLLSNERLFELLSSVDSNSGLELVVHFSPQSVCDTVEYQKFMEKTNARRHSVQNDNNKYWIRSRLSKFQANLHAIDSKIHPILGMKSDPSPLIYDMRTAEKMVDNHPKLYTKYYFRKNLAQRNQDDNEGHLCNSNTVEMDRLGNKTYPRIVFLGTASGSSSLFRGASGILVHISEDQAVLLDCGDGVVAQLHRFYGNQAAEVVRRIRGVFVSHMHLDHHIGLPELFRMREKYLPSDRLPLHLMCPLQDLKSWLFFYANNIDSIHRDMKFIDNGQLTTVGLNDTICKYLGFDCFRTCHVPHYKASHGVTMDIRTEGTEADVFRLTFSGDTMPADDFVKLGKDSTLLIHEATFQDELKDMAKQKNHTTVSQAIEQGKRMNAKYTILTHFSQRYTALPYIQGNLNHNVGIAFDFMEITMSDLHRLSSLHPKYQEIFEEEMKVLRDNTNRFVFQSNFEED